MDNPLNNESALPEKRIWALLGTLSKSDWKHLMAYAQQAAVGSDISVIKLFQRIIKWMPPKHEAATKDSLPWKEEAPAQFLNRPALFNMVFGTSAYKQERLLDTLRNAYDLVEEFIAWQQLRKDKTKISQYTCDHLALLEDEELFQYQWARWKKALSDDKGGHHAFFQNIMLHFTLESHWTYDRQEKPATGFQQATDQYINFLKIGADSAASSNKSIVPPKVRPAISTKENTKNKGNSPLKNIQPTVSKPSPRELLADLYTNLYNLIQNPNAPEEEWQKFASQYRDYFDKLDYAQQQTLLRIQINAYIHLYKKGKSIFLEYLFDLYDWVLDQKLFAKKWVLSPADFLNCTIAAGLKGNLDVMHRIIMEYGKKLPQSLREGTQALAKAYHAYYNYPACAKDCKEKNDKSACVNYCKNLLKSEQYLESIHQRKAILSMRRHSLLLRIAYEKLVKKEDPDKINTVLETYEAYFEDKGNKLETNSLEAYRRLGFFVKRMQKEFMRHTFNEKHHPAKKEDLLKDLNDETQPRPIAYEWIKAQIERL